MFMLSVCYEMNTLADMSRKKGKFGTVHLQYI